MSNQADAISDLPPPFPKDVSTAPLVRLSLKKLKEHDVEETKSLIDACETIGFFYLDFRDAGPHSSILDEAEQLFALSKQFFDLELEEKKKFDFSTKNPYFGYKVQGASVVDGHGNRDRNESYNMAKDDIFGLMDPLPRPEPFQIGTSAFKSFMATSHSIVTLLLDIFDENLGLPEGTLASLHQFDAKGADSVRLIKAPPHDPKDREGIVLRQHTDYGSVTLVFNQLGGLQVLLPGDTPHYVYVEPLPGHAIVNIGDALAKFTNGLFWSSVHRIVAPPGAQGDFTRYSVIYFSRANENVPLRRLEGSKRIPPLANGVTEEDVTNLGWILKHTLGTGGTQRFYELEESAVVENLGRRVEV